MIASKQLHTLSNDEKDQMARVIERICAAESLLEPIKPRNALTRKVSESLKQAATCAALAIACPPHIAPKRNPRLFTSEV